MEWRGMRAADCHRVDGRDSGLKDEDGGMRAPSIDQMRAWGEDCIVRPRGGEIGIGGGMRASIAVSRVGRE
jgi:hypothetical protein